MLFFKLVRIYSLFYIPWVPMEGYAPLSNITTVKSKIEFQITQIFLVFIF